MVITVEKKENGPVVDRVFKFSKKFPMTVAWRKRSHAEVVEKHLNPGEKVLYAFCAQKNASHGEIFGTCCFTLTNKRILIGQKRLLFGYTLTSITPDLFNDLEVYQGIIWGMITIDTVKEIVNLSNLDKKSLDEIETNITEFMMNEKKKYNNKSN